MQQFKNCPLCQGDLILEIDLYGSYERCLECGYTHDIYATFDSQSIQGDLIGMGYPHGLVPKRKTLR